jgi:hypothetical protein
MKFKRFSLIVVSMTLLSYAGLRAAPTTVRDAEMVASGWLKASVQPLGMNLGRRVGRIETFKNYSGKAVYHIVYLSPSGFVIVSADDTVEPIIGFADGGDYDPSADNPLGALVTDDLNSRVGLAPPRAAGIPSNALGTDLPAIRGRGALDTGLGPPINAGDGGASPTLQTVSAAASGDGPRDKWRYFIDLAENPDDGYSLMSVMCVSDVHVLPLVQSRSSLRRICPPASSMPL